MVESTGAQRAQCCGQLWTEREEGGERLRQQKPEYKITEFPPDCSGLFDLVYL